MTRFRRSVLFFMVLAGITLSSCADSSRDIPSLRYRTADERKTCLSALQHAWAERSDDISENARQYEQAVLNRAALFASKVKGTETYQGACVFWAACVRAHTARYKHDVERLGR